MKKRGSFKGISLILMIITVTLIINLAAAFFEKDNSIMLATDIVAILLAIFCMLRYLKKNRERVEYAELLNDKKITGTNEVLNSFPLAIAVFDIDGAILWFNEEFQNMTESNNLYFTKITTLFPDIQWMEILKSDDNIKTEIAYNNKVFSVFGKIAKSGDVEATDGVYSVILYFEDITELVNIRKTYNNEKTDIAIVNIDNYDEIFQRMDDTQSQETISKINSFIMRWGAESEAVTKHIERDKYLLFFEHKHLETYIKEKFDVIEKVRKLGEEIKNPVTISIGIGTGGHIGENEKNAREAMEMVWGRGGDQVAVKSGDQYTFYGGVAKDYEKSTRVKTRAFSVALRNYIGRAENVIFMGHSNADFDAFGAAMGLQRAVRQLSKKPYIVCDNSKAISTIIADVNANAEYDGMLITPDEALEIATEETLLVILDTHRKPMLPVPELLNCVGSVVIIDHHRRSTDFINPVSLTYHEPYASSTCEMVVEILQHIGDVRKVTLLEAQALYMGILMDTKNFVVKTGTRTFEAASYLKRCGLNTIEIKKLFSTEREDYIHKLEIIKDFEVYADSVAIAVCDREFKNMKVIASQAADELMSVSGIKAAFVVYPIDSVINISARSYGDMNVQIIAEKLGGGGHATIAGAQISDKPVEEVLEELKAAIKEKIEE